MMNDDSDVKIFGAEKQNKVRENCDILKLADEMTQNRKNGNSAKAKQLGRALGAFAAESFLKDERFALLREEYVESGQNIQILNGLLLFAAESCLHMVLESSLVITTAINAMYDYLAKHEKELFESVTDGVAFSFYYLAMKKGGDFSDFIGVAFAIVCSDEENERLICFGKELYITACGIVRDMIIKAKFS